MAIIQMGEEGHFFLPISGSTESISTDIHKIEDYYDISKSKSLIDEIKNNQLSPTEDLSELTSEATFTHQLDLKAALSLNIPLGNIDTNSQWQVMIQEYSKYKDISSNDNVLRWGISIRWIVNFKSINVNANLSSLPLIAASAQLGLAQAEARFEVRGISSEKITNLIPASCELKVDTYAEMNKSLVEIKNLIYDQNTIIRPQILALDVTKRRTKDNYKYSVLVHWILNQICKGKSLDKVISKVNSHDGSIDVLKSIYNDILGDNINNIPNKHDKKKACDILKTL